MVDSQTLLWLIMGIVLQLGAVGGLRTTVWSHYRPTYTAHINMQRVVEYALKTGFRPLSAANVNCE